MNNKMDTNLTGMWVSFFTAAGIPSDVSATYALTFTENRIQNDMLLDLNKEYLRDMGITRMGDVIAILRHAKQVHESAARDRVLSSSTAKVPVAAVTGRSTTTQSSSAASRILEHYTRNSQVETSPSSSLKRKAINIGSEPSVSLKKSRLIRFGSPSESPTKDAGANKTVFARLGANSEKIETTKSTVKPIYARLGTKSECEDKNVIPVPKDALKYEGILKSSIVTKKIVTVTTSKNNVRKIAMGTMRADETPLSVREKLALPKAKSVKFSNTIEYKEIEGIKKPKNVTAIKAVQPKYTPVFNKPERRLSMPDGASVSAGVKARLGLKSSNANNISITRSIFNRLGV